MTDSQNLVSLPLTVTTLIHIQCAHHILGAINLDWSDISVLHALKEVGEHLQKALDEISKENERVKAESGKDTVYGA